MGEVYDCVVVGAGVEGLSTAWQLALKKKKTLLLEQFPFPHIRGSSGGQTRITRLAYRHPGYVRMMLEAHETWKRMEERTQTQLYRKTGVLVMGQGDLKAFSAYKASLDEAQVPSEFLSTADLSTRFGHLCTPPAETQGLFEPDGGLLYAQRCLQALMKCYKDEGGEFRECVEIQRVVPGEPVVLQARSGESFRGKSVVLCLGPWAPKFLNSQFSLRLPMQAWRTFCCYWKVTGEDPDLYSTDKGTPQCMIREPDGAAYFFKSSLEYPGLLYFGLHWGEPCDPDSPNEITPDRYIEKSRAVARKYKLNIDLNKPAVLETCIYTECADSDFILDRVPQHKNIVIGTGFTGHGFKIAPVVGKLLSELALNLPPSYPMHMFSINRFNPKSLL